MYAVAGVSGNTGKVVAEKLLAAGQAVRVIVRDPAKGASWAAKGASVAVADLTDSTALTAALQDVRGAYLLVPPNVAVADFGAYQDAVVAAQRQAVGAARVPHVVFLSSVGAQHVRGTGPIAGLHRAEAALSTLPATRVTFVRAGYFMENLASSLGQLADGVVPSFFPSDFELPAVATRDIGALVAALLLEGPAGAGGAGAEGVSGQNHTVVQLGGPGLTMRSVALELTALTGRDVVVAEAPVSIAAQVLSGFGLPATVAALYQEMMEGILAHHVAWDAALPVRPGTTPVRAVLQDLLGA